MFVRLSVSLIVCLERLEDARFYAIFFYMYKYICLFLKQEKFEMDDFVEKNYCHFSITMFWIRLLKYVFLIIIKIIFDLINYCIN